MFVEFTGNGIGTVEKLNSVLGAKLPSRTLKRSGGDDDVVVVVVVVVTVEMVLVVTAADKTSSSPTTTLLLGMLRSNNLLRWSVYFGLPDIF